MTAFEGIVNEKNKKTAFKGILTTLALVIDSLKETASDKRGYIELRGIVQFIKGVLPSVREELCSKRVDLLIPLLKKFFQALMFKKKKKPEGVIAAIDKVKKVPSIADLKATMEGVRTNGSAISACL